MSEEKRNLIKEFKQAGLNSLFLLGILDIFDQERNLTREGKIMRIHHYLSGKNYGNSVGIRYRKVAKRFLEILPSIKRILLLGEVEYERFKGTLSTSDDGRDAQNREIIRLRRELNEIKERERMTTLKLEAKLAQLSEQQDPRYNTLMAASRKMGLKIDQSNL